MQKRPRRLFSINNPPWRQTGILFKQVPQSPDIAAPDSGATATELPNLHASSAASFAFVARRKISGATNTKAATIPPGAKGAHDRS